MFRITTSKAVLFALLVVAALLAPMIAPDPAVAQGRPVVEIKPTTNPSAVSPGTTGSVQLALKNAGNVSATKLEARLLRADAGLVVSPQGPVNLGGLGARASTTVSPFIFTVPAATRPGVYRAEFALLVQHQGTSGTVQEEHAFSAVVTVQAVPTLLVQALHPDGLEAGVPTDANITLANLGQGRFQDIMGSWSSREGTILPLGGGNRFQVASLGPGNTTDIPVRLSTKPGATPGLYSITFQLEYRDVGGTPFNSTSSVGVLVLGALAADVVVSIQDVDSDTLVLAVTNVGVNTVTGVTVRVEPRAGIAVQGTDTIVLGNLLAGEFLTAEFEVSRPRGEDGLIDALAVVEYTDAAGVRRSEPQAIGLPGEEETPGLSAASAAALAVAVVLLVEGAVAAVLVMRRRRRASLPDPASKADEEWERLKLESRRGDERDEGPR